MKIATLNKLMTGLCLLGAALISAVFYLLIERLEEENNKLTTLKELYMLGEEMNDISEELTTSVRRYAIDGAQIHYDAYFKEVNETKRLEEILQEVKRHNIPDGELSLLEEAKAQSDALLVLEAESIKLVQAGNRTQAIEMLYGSNYQKYRDSIISLIKKFKAKILEQEDSSFLNYYHGNLLFKRGSLIAVGLVSILVIIMHMVFRRRVATPLSNLTESISRISSGTPEVDIPYTGNRDEIGQLARAAVVFKEKYLENRHLAKALAANQGNLEHIIAVRTRELMEKTKQAEEASRVKGDFLAIISHELRTPLSGVVGMCELLRQTKLSPRQSRFADTINSSADILLKLISDILDLSLMADGRLELQTAPSDLYADICAITEQLEPVARELGVELSVDYGPRPEMAFELDSERIRQIVLNLMSNAVKFNRNGFAQIRVKFNVSAENDNEGLLILYALDDGIGIAREQQGKIFQQFSQIDSTASRKYGGTGLGLNFCKKLVKIMGGTITLESEINKGSLFKVELPVRISRDVVHQHYVKMREKLQSSASEMKVLVVEENLAISKAISSLLGHFQIAHEVASDRQSAILKMNGHSTQNDYQVILIDEKELTTTPEAFARDIRESSNRKELRLILLVSGNGDDKFVHYRNFGYDACIAKPLYLKDLEDNLFGNTTQNGSEQPELAASKTATEPSKLDSRKPLNGSVRNRPLILVAEDSYANQLYIKETLDRLGCDVIIAENGQKALDTFQNAKPDLILMDCMMPIMDGYQATSLIRNFETDNNLPYTPILAMTANVLEGQRKKCLDIGMDDYITKPARMDVIQAMLANFLGETVPGGCKGSGKGSGKCSPPQANPSRISADQFGPA